MKRASIRDLHIRTSELVREASEGDVIVIERRGQPVAELRPITQQTPKKRLPDMKEFWKSMPKMKLDSGRILEEDR
jgi:prevent-host-death family protein